MLIYGATGAPLGTPAELMWNKLNFCGCGDPVSAVKALLAVMDALAERQKSDWKNDRVEGTLPDGAWSLIPLYVLDAAGLTEHGGSVTGSWLTPEGEALRNWLHATPDDQWFPDEPSPEQLAEASQHERNR